MGFALAVSSPGIYLMSLPSSTLTVPTFSQYPSAQFQGAQATITLGPAPFYIRGDNGQYGLEGLDMPTVMTGDPEAPRINGQFVGFDKLSARSITITLDIGPPFGSYTNLSGAMAALRSALTPSYTVEYPLFIQLPNGPELVSMVRPRKRSTLVDLPYTVGQLAQNVPIQFSATDPTLFAAGTLGPSVGVPAPLGGFTFAPPTTYTSGVTGSMSFNLTFGGGTEYSVINATNYGDLPCYPLITFTGPCTSPTLTNSSIVGTPYIQFGVIMNAGDLLVVNTDPKYRSAVYFTSGTTDGADRLYTLVQGSSWWALPPDSTSQIQFTTLDTVAVAGTCTMEYSSAYSAAN